MIPAVAPRHYILSAGLLLMILLCAVSSSQGLTSGEKATIDFSRKYARGVVNITSAAHEAEFLLRPFPHSGSGSGFIFDDSGHVVTSFSLLSDIHSIEVTLWDGTAWQAKLLGKDEETDIAVLEIRAPSGVLKKFSPLRFSDSGKVQTGQQVFALGNPFGLGAMVSSGIISHPGRSIATPRGNVIDDVIETDIVVHPSISGGPLLDSSGRVVGLDTTIFEKPGRTSPVGFALPSGLLRLVTSQILTKGHVTRVWMGAGFYSVSPLFAEILNLPVEYGAMVTEVEPEGPAEKAGLKGSAKRLRLGNRIYPVGGDIIVSINGKKVDSVHALLRVLQAYEPGDRVLVAVYRGERLRKYYVRLGGN